MSARGWSWRRCAALRPIRCFTSGRQARYGRAEFPAVWRIPVPESGSTTLARLRGRLLFAYNRLALGWQARKLGRGRPVALTADSAGEPGMVCVDDGMRKIHVPHVRRSAEFSDGINARLETVADKYFGVTGYAPREGDIVIDIGAGMGEFTLWCANAGARVIAFEPDPLAFACLEKNTSALSGVQIYPYALWKERTNLRLHGSLDTAESSLIEDGKAHARNVDVQAWPLDQLQFMTRLPVIDLMKIDGEGVEPEIILGASRTLVRTRVVAIDIEATDRRPNLRARVETALAGLNFRTVLHDRGDTILALNTSMVGPFNNRVLGRRGS
jgi:FkbM family methyltransferase